MTLVQVSLKDERTRRRGLLRNAVSTLTLDYDRRTAQIITDAAAGTLYLNFIGEISGELSDGCTHAVDNNSVFMGDVNASGNTYKKVIISLRMLRKWALIRSLIFRPLLRR